MAVRLVQRVHPLQMVPAAAETESLQISASLHNALSEQSMFVGNKMKIKLVGNICRISLK